MYRSCNKFSRSALFYIDLQQWRNKFNFYFRQTGKFSHTIESGHLFVPRRVHANGTHLTYNVTHYHQPIDDNEFPLDDKLHYHIDLHDGTMHIELE